MIRDFYKKRFVRILVPTVTWFIILNVFGKTYDNPNNSFWIAKTPHFWYMYALLGVYLVLPIVSSWYKHASNKSRFMYLALWVFSLIFVIINKWCTIKLEYSHQGFLFSTPFHSFLYVSGYLGYFLLGAIIRDYYRVLEKHIRKVVIIGLVTYVVIYLALRFARIADSNAIAYLSLPTSILSTVLFLLFFRLGDKLKEYLSQKESRLRIMHVLVDFSNATFSIYLMHILVLQLLSIPSIGGYLRLGIGLSVFFSCFAVYKVLSFLPFSKYFLG